MSSPELERGEEELVVGHNGAGDDCITKVVTYGRNSALAGEISVLWCALVRIIQRSLVLSQYRTLEANKTSVGDF